MKEKILTAVSTLMIFIPWTILPLRTFNWALESPAAEIIVYSYAAFMVFSGIFTLLSYTTAGVKNNLRGRKIFCVYGKNSSLIRNRYV